MEHTIHIIIEQEIWDRAGEATASFEHYDAVREDMIRQYGEQHRAHITETLLEATHVFESEVYDDCEPWFDLGGPRNE